MSLTIADFEGFDLDAAQRYLQSFDAHTRKKGESYFRGGAVESFVCHEPGRAYSVFVRGSLKYEVSFYYDDGWDSDCSCPVGYECKHTYAAWKRLLAEYSSAAVADLSATAGKQSDRPRSAKSRLASSAPGTFTDAVRAEVERKLTKTEERYLDTVSRLYRQATNGGLYYLHELNALGINVSTRWWDRLELYPEKPKTEAGFWNYLALFLTEKLNKPIPDFLEPFTDLAAVRDEMRQHQRGKEIQRWTQTLSGLVKTAYAAGDEPAAAAEPVELRLRFTPQHLVFEWRPAGGEWTELKPGKLRDFEAIHAPQLSAEAALLWLPYWQRNQIGGATNYFYDDSWTEAQIGRWLRQPLLRPLLVDAQGEPLVFHDEPVRWLVAQPDKADGDYLFSLVQASGEPLPKIWLATSSRPTFYLTPIGVFSGPPFDPHLGSLNNQTFIPAPAFESPGGLRLLDRLQIPPPPRLAARVRTVPLRPGIRAEVKKPWSGQTAEYCFMDVFGASEDGEHVESWLGNGWVSKKSPPAQSRNPDFVRLDRSALGALVSPLAAAGFKWDYYANRWQLRLTKKFAETFVPFLKALPAGTNIELGGELASFQNAEIAGKIRLEASEAEMDWFDLQVIVDVNDTTLTQAEIRLLLNAKGGWVRLDQKGWRKLEFSLSQEEDAELARLGLTPHELTGEPQRLHAFQLADKAARKFLPEETCDRIERRAAELQARVTPAVPDEIRAEMRPYQRDGFHFLCYLATNHFGGILADDMGLGKTVQTLAWLAWLRKGGAAGKGPATALPSLVVCPKSVADNWHAEAVKFFPSLKVRVWSASELKSFAGLLASADLHVLNYSQLRLVGDDLARERFQAVILDEGQYIKNPSSQTAQVARQLRAEHRLILSGTPIENRLLDLWSLMSFAMPGALGSRAEFGRLFDAKGDPFARQRLSARVRPFLIRRTKAQVARDLPDRMEEDLFCELEGEQKTLYRAELKRAQAMLLGVKTAAALNKQRFNFLTSLLRLRQICCHPRLVKENSRAASAKVEALIETLEPLIEEGEKVLVFSQFVGLLDILRAEVKNRKWHHWYLAGDTEDRGALVKEFQAVDGAGVFLISLKAGGFGLNLTAASYVVLFDPWWNPAVENQAIDRTHRIGQTRKVMAYRLLIKDSIEEKIRALQKQKSSLANDVLGEEKFSQSLSLDDLRYLLAD
jgi:hypothetical protein